MSTARRRGDVLKASFKIFHLESISRDLDANDDQEDAADQPPPPSLTMEERFLHAARYLREGQGNLDFNKHPKDSNALAAASYDHASI